MDLMEIRRQMMGVIASRSGSGLPAGYLQVEYLEGTGTQYIDSGIECTGDLSVEFKFRVPNSVNSAFCGGIDTDTGISNVYFRHHCSPYLKAMYWIQNNSGQASVTRANQIVLNTDYTVKIDAVNGVATVSGIDYSFTPLPGTLTTGRNYGIFGRIADTGNIQSRASRIYYFKFVRNNKLIGDFIPCIRITDSKPGMYDLVSRQFFTNAGTGEFNTPT